ncbi:MAG: primosomal protein N' [Gammaproteobacteria bacterium]|nr:primosomal protein N' [Gammaproteobacteria bacterium]
MSTSQQIVKVAVPAPLRQLLDYAANAPIAIGTRVLVPLGRRQCVGVVLAHADDSEYDELKLAQPLDEEPALSPTQLHAIARLADYVHAPIGEVVQSALPVALRDAKQTLWQSEIDYRPLEVPAQRAKRQCEVYAKITAKLAIDEADKAIVRQLIKNQCIEPFEQRAKTYLTEAPAVEPSPPLTNEQQSVLAALTNGDQFAVHLLEGVTGSGKTRVYIEWLQRIIQQGKQTLLLVPEISLTPQTYDRLQKALGVKVAWQHSGMTDAERLRHWRAAKQGEARLLVGTRSSVFAELPELGAIVIDEEHDSAYKQQDGLRYSAKTMAILRAQALKIPVVLGSATPSLETLQQASQGQYQHLRMTERATGSAMPSMQLVDMRPITPIAGLSPLSIEAIRRSLANDEQCLIFINRRGYAPTYYCETCGHVVGCHRCDARMTVHHRANRLKCHHCSHEQPLPTQCPSCQSVDVRLLGHGTERISEELSSVFDQVPVVRIDRDSASTNNKLKALLAQAQTGDPMILVGTQMLAKGHDFAKLSTVVVIDADQSLLSQNLRAAEELAQTLTQVAGRAGRSLTKGRVLIQTRTPDHSLLRDLIHRGYQGASQTLLEERKIVGFPPYRRMAAIRTESTDAKAALGVLDTLAHYLEAHSESVDILGPAPSLMWRRQGRFRGQILLLSDTPNPLHKTLRYAESALDHWKEAKKVRWHIDVDPYELI